jgi:hypothetical protein
MELSYGENDVVALLLCMYDITQQSNRLDFHDFYTWVGDFGLKYIF